MLNAEKTQNKKVQSRLLSGKNILMILAAMFTLNIAAAQNMRDVVYLKNGSVIKGSITEQIPDSIIKIKTADGNLFTYPFAEVEKITREENKVSTASGAFQIKSPFGKTTYNGTSINNIKWKTLKSTLLSVNDAEINSNMQKINTKRTIGMTTVILGNILMAVGLSQMLTADVMAAGGGEGTGLIAAGAGVMLVGAIAGAGTKGLMKKSMIKYNSVAGANASVQIQFTPLYYNRNFVPGFTFAKKF